MRSTRITNQCDEWDRDGNEDPMFRKYIPQYTSTKLSVGELKKLLYLIEGDIVGSDTKDEIDRLFPDSGRCDKIS